MRSDSARGTRGTDAADDTFHRYWNGDRRVYAVAQCRWPDGRYAPKQGDERTAQFWLPGMSPDGGASN